MLLPPNLEELIPPSHMVRIVNNFIESVDLSILTSSYKGGGTSSYHPKMLLKVLVYAYARRIYSSRQIAAALRENIHFMWLSGGNNPDFRTINRFRGERLAETIQEVFAKLIEYLIDQGYVNLSHYFPDGTKIEANANKYSYVWKKTITRYQDGIRKKIKELFEEIDQVNEEEDRKYGDQDLEEVGEGKEINSEEIEELANQLNEKLRENPDDQKAKRQLKKLTSDLIPRMKKYESYQANFGNRNSFSKTDHDATFMRMKGDSMREPIMKPGYNAQIGTENQFIVGFSVHQNPSDTVCLIPHLEQLENNLKTLPEKMIADAGYGSEENYVYLKSKNVEPFVKYSTFDREHGKVKIRKRRDREKYASYHFVCDETTGEVICPEGKHLSYVETNEKATRNGFMTSKRFYRCEHGSTCPVRDLCTTAPGGRRSLEYSPRLVAFKKQVAKILNSEEGLALRSQRLIESEAVFGMIKHNMNFRRFHLRGLKKVATEWGIVSMAHNMIKLAAI